MKNELVYDTPRSEEMNDFLKRLYKIGYQNNIFLNDSIVYDELCRYDLKAKDLGLRGSLMDNEEFFDQWGKKYSSDSEISAFRDMNWPYFFQFRGNVQKNKQNLFIKLYIPLNYEHLYYGVNRIFDYVKSLQTSHKSKVSQEIRSDNVIIRLNYDDFENAKKIIDFVNNDSYIKEGLNKTNPFVPSINGIGCMIESGISYNMKISTLITNYVNHCISRGKEGSINEFNDYFLTHNQDKEVGQIFEYAIKDKKHLTDYSNSEKNSSKKEYNDIKTIINEIYSYYGPEKTKMIVKSFLKEDNNTKEVLSEKFYDWVKNKFSKQEIIQNINETIKKENEDIMYALTLDHKIDLYCNIIHKEDLVQNLEDICTVTLENYDISHLQSAISHYIDEDNVLRFSRFKLNDSTNYRALLRNKFDQKSFISTMKTSLQQMGIDTKDRDLSFIINNYCYTLNDKVTNKYNNKSKEIDMMFKNDNQNIIEENKGGIKW